jgi:hypothetical protein
MKTFTIYTALAIFAAISHAAPFEAQARNDQVQITFQGAPPDVAFFTQYFPIDGRNVHICASSLSTFPHVIFSFHLYLSNPSPNPPPFQT